MMANAMDEQYWFPARRAPKKAFGNDDAKDIFAMKIWF
jgi:hypothetical protein